MAIVTIAEVDWNATDAERFPWSKFNFVPPTPGETRKRADGTEFIKAGHNEIRPVYQEKLVDCRMSCDFAERAWHLIPQKGHDYTEYPIFR